MAKNILNSVTGIKEYLSHMAGGDEQIQEILFTILKKPLLNDASCIQPVTQLPQNAPDWLKSDWSQSGDFQYPRDPHNVEQAQYYHFMPPQGGSDMDTKVQKVVAGVKKALADKAVWRRETREFQFQDGTPSINFVGNDTMEKVVETLSIVTPRPDAIMEWPKGYYIRKLESLDDIYAAQEGLLNQKLEVKSEEYDVPKRKQEIEQKLAEGREFYVLHGKPAPNYPTGHCAILEVKDGELLKCEGRQYQPPTEPSDEYVREFIIKQKLNLDFIKPKWTGLIQVGEQYHNIHKLKEMLDPDTVLPGHQDLSDIKHKIQLPDRLNVEGDLSLRGSHIDRFPDDADIRGKTNVSRTRLKNLGNNKLFHGDVDVSNSDISGFNEGTYIHGNLNMAGAENISKLPNGNTDATAAHHPRMVVYGDLTLNRRIAEQNLQEFLDDIRQGNIEVKGQIKAPLGTLINKPVSYRLRHQDNRTNSDQLRRN